MARRITMAHVALGNVVTTYKLGENVQGQTVASISTETSASRIRVKLQDAEGRTIIDIANTPVILLHEEVNK